MIFADSGYSGQLIGWVAQIFHSRIRMEIVQKLEDQQHSFTVLKWRWIVERTFGWLGRYRRLSRDYEARPKTSENWIRLAMINVMVRRLAARGV